MDWFPFSTMDANVVEHSVPNGRTKEEHLVEEQEEEQEDKIAIGNKRREIQFKASHALLIGFFLWILYVSTRNCPGT